MFSTDRKGRGRECRPLGARGVVERDVSLHYAGLVRIAFMPALAVALVACKRDPPQVTNTLAPTATPTPIADAQPPSSARTLAPLTIHIEPDASAGEPCSDDSACTITTFGGCCACPSMPYAAHNLTLDRRQRECAAVDCRAFGECPKVASPTAYRAACKLARCVAEQR